jgi:hypothetical protein
VHVVCYFVIFCAWVGIGWGFEDVVACEFGVEADEGVMVLEDFECFLKGCGWREGSPVGEGCRGVKDLVVSWTFSISSRRSSQDMMVMCMAVLCNVFMTDVVEKYSCSIQGVGTLEEGNILKHSMTWMEVDSAIAGPYRQRSQNVCGVVEIENVGPWSDQWQCEDTNIAKMRTEILGFWPS